MHLVIFEELLLATSLAKCSVASHGVVSASSQIITIIGSLEFSTPKLNDSRESMKERSFNAFVQLGNPVLQVGVTLEIQSVNL